MIEDIDYNGIDFGVRGLVRWLRENGFDTCDSGDGYSKPEDARVFNHHHVFILCDKGKMASEADRLAGLLSGIGIEVLPTQPVDGSPEVGATYDPASGCALIHLFHVGDDDLAAHGVEVIK